MKKKTKRFEEEDDGRSIAPMNVDGMPWYAGREKEPESGDDSERKPEPLTPEGRRAFIWGTLKAVLLVSSIFIIVYFLFILFCTQIWIK